MKTSVGGWLAILGVIGICLFLVGSILNAGTPEYADPMNGEHIKALQPKACPFGLCDKQNQNSADTNLTNMKAEHEAGDAAVGFAVATAITNQSQPNKGINDIRTAIWNCIWLPLLTIAVIALIGIVTGKIR